MDPINIIVVEDHEFVRQALTLTLARVGDAVKCLQAGDAQEAIKHLEANPFCDLIVVDLMLPGIDGYELLEIISKRFRSVPAIVLSAVDDEEFIEKAFSSGANGFVSKTATSDEILSSVKIVMDGGSIRPAKKQAGSVRTPGYRSKDVSQLAQEYGLTSAQTRVLSLLAQGLNNNDIAEQLGLQNGTVRVHVSAVFKAMGVKNRSQALLALAKGGMKVQ